MRPKRLSRAAEAWLGRYRWPGNVRELGHLLERVTLLSQEAIGSPSTLEALGLPQPPAPMPAEPTAGVDASGRLEERTQLQAVLRQTRGNVVQAARLLGLSRGALRHRLRRYGLQRPQQSAPSPAPLGDPPATGVPATRGAKRAPERPTAPSPAWEHKPVAVLAIELTFPTVTAGEAAAYEPWTAANRWEQALVATVQGFGGVMLQRSPALLLVAFGIPHTLEQRPQRAVQAALAARIDRLPPAAKRLLQTAAVIGTEVPWPLLQAIADLPDEALHRGLVHLQAAEFLYETRLFPEPDYTFKHALTQQVAYSCLAQDRQRALHARIVDALEALAGDRMAAQVERLAHHALRGEVWDKAVTYCQQAGARAHDRAAFRAAVNYCEQALQALVHLPEYGETRVRAIELRLALRTSLAPLGEYGRCLALLGEAEALARALDDRARLARVLAATTNVRRITGDHDGAMAAGRQALALAAELGNSALQGQAFYFLGQTYFAIGDFGRAAELQRWSVEAADRESGTPSTDVRIGSRARLARTLGTLGAFAEGRRHGEEALRLATLAGRGQTPIIAHGCLGHLYLGQGDLGHAIQVLEQGLALCRASGNRNWWARDRGKPGLCRGAAGAPRGGACAAGGGDQRKISMGLLYGLPPASPGSARLSARGTRRTAWKHARQALDLARQLKERGSEALALHQLGTVQAHADPPDAAQAEAHYQQALVLAEALGMRPLVAHCHHGLGRLYGQIGRREEARVALTTAIDLYRAMAMTFWLPQAEAVLAEVEGP